MVLPRPQLAIADLLVLPLILIASVPVVQVSEVVGWMLSPEWHSPGSLRDFAHDIGFPVSIAAGQISFTSLQLPGIVLLSIYAATLLLFLHRWADWTALTTLLAVPSVDAITHGIWYLKTQVVTFGVVISISLVYVVIRRSCRGLYQPRPTWSVALYVGTVTAICCVLKAFCE